MDVCSGASLFTTTHDLTLLDLGAWVQDTTLCPGQSLALASGDIQGEWSGNGVLGPPWTFDAWESGIGVHTVTFTAFGTAALASSSSIPSVYPAITFAIPSAIAASATSAAINAAVIARLPCRHHG